MANLPIANLSKANLPKANLPKTDLVDALQKLPGGDAAPRFDENWRYTSLKSAIGITERWIASGSSNAAVEELSTPISNITAAIEANWIVIANGVVDRSRISASAAIDIRERPAVEGLEMNALQSLNAAIGSPEVLISIHAATELPLALLYVDSSIDGSAVANTNVRIDVDPGCDAEIVEYHSSSGDGEHYANSSLTLTLADGSSANWVRIQERKIGHLHTAQSHMTVARNARLQMSGFDLGGGLIRNDLKVELTGTGASADFSGLYLAGDSQHVDNHTSVDHRVGPATSSQEYRGILNGRCRCVWNGKAVVHEGADGTDANQANHNLLLSDNAEIDTKPELEIYAEDVKCSHGTTVGQLDESALFYLQTRGIDKDSGRQMLTRAFAADLVARVSVAACSDVISDLVERRLADLIEEASE